MYGEKMEHLNLYFRITSFLSYDSDPPSCNVVLWFFFFLCIAWHMLNVACDTYKHMHECATHASCDIDVCST